MYGILKKKTNLETIIKGISRFLHQSKNSRNPGSSRISVDGKGNPTKDTHWVRGGYIFSTLHKPRRSISLHSSNVCPLATTLANIFLNPSLQDNTSANYQFSYIKKRTPPKVIQSNKYIEVPLPSLLLPIPQIIGHIWDYSWAFDHMEWHRVLVLTIVGIKGCDRAIPIIFQNEKSKRGSVSGRLDKGTSISNFQYWPIWQHNKPLVFT